MGYSAAALSAPNGYVHLNIVLAQGGSISGRVFRPDGTTPAAAGAKVELFDVNDLDPPAKAHLKEHLFQDYLPLTELPVAESNPLLEEQREFVTAIRGEAVARVPGTDGRRALDVAERVLATSAAHRWDGAAAGAVGPRFEVRESVLRGPHWRQSVRHRKAG